MRYVPERRAGTLYCCAPSVLSSDIRYQPVYDDLTRAHANGQLCDAELACAYVIDRVQRAHGSRWLQGARRPPMVAGRDSPLVLMFAAHRLACIEAAVARALVAWARGERRVHLLFAVPPALHVLGWQARGERCVSLLPDGASTAPHADGLAFALHDLCHLEKFVEPEHHLGQTGFFSALHAAMTSAAWASFVGRFDEELVREVDHVAADMNGSAIFLFAALKMKLKMASRRKRARARGSLEPTHGPLDPAEARAYEEHEEQLFDLLGLTGQARAAAQVVSTRRDAHAASCVLLAHFEERASAGSTIPRVSGSTQTHDAVASANPRGTPSPPAIP